MGESLREKLRRLRREAPAEGREREAPVEASERAIGASAPSRDTSAPSRDTSVPSRDTSALPLDRVDLASSLERRTDRLARRSELRASARVARSRANADARFGGETADAPSIDRARVELPPSIATTRGLPRDLERSGDVLARRVELAIEHRHGDGRLGEALGADAELLSLCAKDAAIAPLAPAPLEHALFLDTETTGLSGGAGTYVFLIGLGRFVGGRFEVWQGFLPDPSGERALLAEVAERVACAPLVVTFFGKAFDRHRLEDKMRLHGVSPPFHGKPHLDLYHPLRRLYGGALADARLRTMERALCGVEREDDLPGSFAPAAWFDFLAGREHLLEGVFRHNFDDVLSLVTLGARAGGAGEERTCALEDERAWRALGHARLLAERGDHARALATLACARGGASSVARAVELAAIALEVRTGALAEARRAIDQLSHRHARDDVATALVRVELLVAERRAGIAVRAEEIESIAELARTRAIGREHAKLCAGLRRLTTAKPRRAKRVRA